MSSKRLNSTADPIIDVLPERGWLREYVDFTSGLEACTRFQFFTACCMLGAALNNHVFIHRGDRELLPKLFPNPWVLLLAPPGRGHKTSTINMGVNCLQQAAPEVRILADKITPESLVKALSAPVEKEIIRIGPRDATGLIRAPEVSVFFGRRTYNEGLIQLITDLYDYRPKFVSETIGRGKDTLSHNCISIIGGSTPVWLQSKLPDDAFSGGFMARFIIVEMPPTYYRRIASPTKPTNASWKRIVDGLIALKDVKGEMHLSAEANKHYTTYYESITPTGNEQFDAYKEREVEQIFRLAMLLAITEETMTVEMRHFDHSRDLLKVLMREAEPRIERLTTHPRMRLVQDIQDLLRTHQSLTRKELLNKLYRSLNFGEQQFIEAIRVLGMAGVIAIDACSAPANPTYKLIKDCTLLEDGNAQLEGGDKSNTSKIRHIQNRNI